MAGSVVLGSETTGQHPKAELQGLAILNLDSGDVLLNTVVMPQGPVTPTAGALLHKLGARPWPEHHETVCRILADAGEVLAYDAEHNRRLLEQTARRYGLALPDGLIWRCVMHGYAHAHGGNCESLETACERELPEEEMIEIPRSLAEAHLSLALLDALLTWRLVGAALDGVGLPLVLGPEMLGPGKYGLIPTLSTAGMASPEPEPEDPVERKFHVGCMTLLVLVAVFWMLVELYTCLIPSEGP